MLARIRLATKSCTRDGEVSFLIFARKPCVVFLNGRSLSAIHVFLKKRLVSIRIKVADYFLKSPEVDT